MADRQSLLRRLAALRKMTETAGCTEAEAANAAALASKLIEEYNLSLDEQDFGTDGIQAIFREMPLDPPEVFNTISAVAYFTDSRIWRHHTADGPIIQMAGTPIDLDLAEWLLHRISAAMQGASGVTILSMISTGEIPKTRGRSFTDHASAFRAGMAERISERLRALKSAEARPTTSTGRDLVVVKKSLADDYLRAHGIRLGKGRAVGAAIDGARAAGNRAGAGVSLHRPTTAARPLSIGRG